ncbi:MAG TPA: MYXO-CTERM sorting domain-containing protein [Polyangiaceae bacterium]|jgi:MYXO-CTERM domain-containing protein|nr:MYXO-CTERM sorting domain-containing protein [Polyangiaceae bacterium]
MMLCIRRIAWKRSLSWALRALLAASGLFLTSPALSTPCVVPEDCASNYCVDGVCCDKTCTGPCEACSAAAKGGGDDGTCGLAAPGSVCDPAHCDDGSFAFVGDATCDAAGTCVYPTPENCLHNNPCQFDLCGDNGCEVSVKIDGTSCGGSKVCVSGVCSGGSASGASSSSSSSSGAGGAGGQGGSGGGGGDGGSGGSGGSAYPPLPEDPGCGCRAAADVSSGSGALVAAAGIALFVRRRRARIEATRASGAIRTR